MVKVETMFGINVRNGACHSQYTYNARFDNIGRALVYSLFLKILDVLEYIGLYRFAIFMGIDLVLTFIAIHRCGEVD